MKPEPRHDRNPTHASAIARLTGFGSARGLLEDLADGRGHDREAGWRPALHRVRSGPSCNLSWSGPVITI